MHHRFPCIIGYRAARLMMQQRLPCIIGYHAGKIDYHPSLQAPKTTKAKGGKAAADDIDVHNIDHTLVNTKYWEAIGKPATK